MPKVTFQPSGRSVDVPEGTSILDAATLAGVSSVECCGKVTLCGLCRTVVLEGEEHLSAPEAQEAEFRLRRRYLPYQRLGCMAYASGDVEVEVDR
jgi:uncharacterized 2Fe-2S/4Fe-4S cluster protein (DUF4445 family)